jgi:cupin 2 domain-containing protein
MHIAIPDWLCSSSENTMPQSKIKLNYDNWPFFPWTNEFADADPPISENGTFDGNWKRLIDITKYETDKMALYRYHGYINVATKLAKRLIEFPEVERIVLFGSLAKPPFRRRYKYKSRMCFHYPNDIDLALWLSSLDNLGAMRRVLATLVPSVFKKTPGICEGAMELFVFDSHSSKYLGRVCHSKQCPRNDLECMCEWCGKPPHLKIEHDFVLHPDAISRINSQLLFERTPANLISPSNLYTDLPTLLPEELIEKMVDSKEVRIERIVSTGHTSPPGFWYDSAESEWVVVLRGEATLAFEDETRILKPGDYVLIPPHRKHRVNSTSTKEPTVWLAVFFGKRNLKVAHPN